MVSQMHSYKRALRQAEQKLEETQTPFNCLLNLLFTSYQKESHYLMLPELSKDLCMFLCLISCSHFPAIDQRENVNNLIVLLRISNFILIILFIKHLKKYRQL